MAEKPQALVVDKDRLPPDLCALPQWVVWRYEEPRRPGDKWTKMPYTPGTTNRAKTNDHTTWRSFSEAWTAYETGGYDGVGFVFSADDPFVGVDLDAGYDPERQEYSERARDVMLLLNSYSELSTSGTGVHVVVRGRLPFNGSNQGWIETYQSLRFFAMTGCAVEGLPAAPEERQAEIDAMCLTYFPRPASKNGSRGAALSAVTLADAQVIERARQASNGPKFEALWNGRWQSLGYASQSQADMALAALLRFYTQDLEQIDRLMRQSGLYRDKWDSKRGLTTYGRYTSNKAIELGGEVYSGNKITMIPVKRQAATEDDDPLAPMEDKAAAAEAEQEATPRYTLHWAREAFEPLPPIEWIVDSLFSRGSVSLVVGAPGAKKTYSLLDCAIAVSTGDEWLGRATSQGTVLLIDEESGDHRLRRRLRELMKGHQTPIDLPIVYTTLAMWNLLSSPADIQQIDNLLAETQPCLVILDALADVMPGGDENAVKDTHPVFQRLRGFAEKYRCAVVVIHHAGKGGGYRGSTAIAGAVDLLLMVDSDKKSTVIVFKTEKSRDTEPQLFAAQILFDTFMGTTRLIGYAVEPEQEQMSKSEQYVIDYLESHSRRAPIEEIANCADVCSPNTARRAVYRLADKGKVRRVDLGKQGEKATYELC